MNSQTSVRASDIIESLQNGEKVLWDGLSDETVRTVLVSLYEVYKNRHGWRDVAALPAFRAVNISAGTLCTIAGGVMPKCWRQFFGRRSRGSRIYQEYNQIAQAKGWANWSEFRRAIRDGKIELPRKIDWILE